ncbi:retrovirus-related pol polyprotein from transposon TNT 1-94 [Tanacetum coccineum]
MASSGSVNDGVKLTSCLKSGQIRDIDGRILGKDGKPMRRAIRVKIGETTVREHQIEEPITDNPYEGLQTPGEWEDPKINAMQTEGSQTKPSFVNVVTGASNECQNPKINFRAMTNPDTIENSDFVLPVEAVQAVKHKFANSLVGFFVGKKVAFPLVKNYVTNTWTKFGFEKIMSDDDDVFYFKFASSKGLQQVLEKGPWLIRNIPLMLTKWSPNMVLSKDKVTRVPVWVKLHKVPAVAYSEDGLSLIATQIGNPIMLDAYTSSMCADEWGRMGYARALVEVCAEKELKKEVVMAIPNIEDEKQTHTLKTIQVDYEWKPPQCLECQVFGHNNEQCPKRITEKSVPVQEINDDGFIKVVNRKTKGKGPVNSQHNYGGFKVNNSNKNLVWEPVKHRKNTTMDTDKKTDSENANVTQDNGVKLKNLFEKLNEITIPVTYKESNEADGVFGDTSKATNFSLDSDSEVEEHIIMEKPKQKGASTLINEVSND